MIRIEYYVIYNTDKRQHDIYKVMLVGSVGNLLLLVFKFVAGIVGHRAAMFIYVLAIKTGKGEQAVA